MVLLFILGRRYHILDWSPSTADTAIVLQPQKKAKTAHKASKTVAKFSVPNVAVCTGSLQFKAKTRRHPEAKLYAFPSFDKSDALVYFPCTLARYLNSSDFPSLSKLVSSHLDKSCDINIYTKVPGAPLNSAGFLALFETMDQVHPDSISCCHSTRVVENEIQSRMYFKYTDCKSLISAVTRTIKDPRFNWLAATSREDRLKNHFNVQNRPQHEQRELTALVESGEDLVVYGEVDLRLTFDDITKKVTYLRYAAEFTSIASMRDPSIKFLQCSAP